LALLHAAVSDIAVVVTKAEAYAAALETGTIARTPAPKAVTATSDSRLKIVFVEICFL